MNIHFAKISYLLVYSSFVFPLAAMESPDANAALENDSASICFTINNKTDNAYRIQPRHTSSNQQPLTIPMQSQSVIALENTQEIQDTFFTCTAFSFFITKEASPMRLRFDLRYYYYSPPAYLEVHIKNLTSTFWWCHESDYKTFSFSEQLEKVPLSKLKFCIALEINSTRKTPKIVALSVKRKMDKDIFKNFPTHFNSIKTTINGKEFNIPVEMVSVRALKLAHLCS